LIGAVVAVEAAVEVGSLIINGALVPPSSKVVLNPDSGAIET
jgi:hypothetical protein